MPAKNSFLLADLHLTFSHAQSKILRQSARTLNLSLDEYLKYLLNFLLQTHIHSLTPQRIPSNHAKIP